MENIVKNILDGPLKIHRYNCPLNITDLVFLEIEKTYIKEYETAVNSKDKDTVNKFIGKKVKELWDLKNLGRCNSPESRLISSYEKHGNK